MPLTLDGLPLTIDPEIEEPALALLDPLEAPEWGASTWPGRAFLGTPWGPFRHPSPPSAPGVLNWPAWGCSRFAYGHFIAHATTAQELVRRAVAGLREAEGEADSSSADRIDAGAFTLRMEAESQTSEFANGEQLSFEVYMLPPRPISRPDPEPRFIAGLGEVLTSAGPYLITVVDRRYYLRNRTARYDLDLELDCGSTWRGLLEALAVDARIDLEVEEPHEDYLVPPASLASLAGQDVGRCLDAVAACIGQRIVAKYDGTFFTQSATKAAEARAAEDQRATARRRRKLGGGDQYPEVY